jgi:hypothetical protein
MNFKTIHVMTSPSSRFNFLFLRPARGSKKTNKDQKKTKNKGSKKNK